jgi:putative transcriptional regulator
MGVEMNLFNINHYLSKVEKGKCLISEPFSLDSYFGRSIVLITQHNDKEGTIGYILNKPVGIKINELFPDFPEFPAQCLLGGPVSPETVHYLHSRIDLLPESSHITGNIYWGGDFELLKEHIENKRITPEEIRFYIGYSGWSPNQLYDEIDNKVWVVTDISTNRIMHADESTWKEMLTELGDAYSLWANAPVNPNMN